jgi:hypothetical protein
MQRLTLGVLTLIATSSPALAGSITRPVPVPGPEAGAGLAAMAIVGLSVAWLRKRRQR